LVDLSGAAKKYGHPGVFRNLWQWLVEGLTGRGVTLTVNAWIGSVASAGSARITQRTKLVPNAGTSERLAAIEANLQQVDSDLSAAFKQVDSLSGELKNKLQDEANARTRAIEELASAERERVRASFPNLAFGAAWVLVGTVLSGLSPELSCAFASCP
jgi:hypothetical protein